MVPGKTVPTLSNQLRATSPCYLGSAQECRSPSRCSKAEANDTSRRWPNFLRVTINLGRKGDDLDPSPPNIISQLVATRSLAEKTRRAVLPRRVGPLAPPPACEDTGTTTPTWSRNPREPDGGLLPSSTPQDVRAQTRISPRRPHLDEIPLLDDTRWPARVGAVSFHWSRSSNHVVLTPDDVRGDGVCRRTTRR